MRTAIFIDVQYFQRVSNGHKIDFGKLSTQLAGGSDLLRTYFYDALPYMPDAPSYEDQSRYDRRERFHYAIGQIPRHKIRLGRVERRGYDEGSEVFEQKRVDIMLGVDLVLLASKHLITDAILIAGDSDFIPAITAAKDEGVVVHLYYGLSNVHKDLLHECDERVLLNGEFFEAVKMD